MAPELTLGVRKRCFMRLTAGTPSAICTCARAPIPFVWETLDTGERAVMTFYKDDQETNEIALDPKKRRTETPGQRHDESARSRPDRVAELDVMHTPAGAKERAPSRS